MTSPAPPTDLSALEARMARIEASMDRMTSLLEQLPPLIAMAGDTADAAVEDLTRRGIDVDDRLHRMAAVGERWTRPEVLDVVGQMSDQLTRAEGTLGMLLDMADAWTAGLANDTQDAEQRLQDLTRLARRLMAPESLELAHKVLDKSDALERLMEVALAAPDSVGMMLDTFDEAMRQAEAQGLDLSDLAERLTRTLVRTLRVAGSDELSALVDSYVLDPAALHVVSQAAGALVEVRSEPAGRAGLFKALSALSDPQIQTALDFAIRFGRRFGASVEAPARLTDNS